MSFGIDTRKLKKLIDLYRPNNHAEQMKYLLILKGEQDLFINLETCPFQGISVNSIQDRRTTFGTNQLSHHTESALAPLKHSFIHNFVFLSVIMAFICFIIEVNGIGNLGVSSIVIVLVALLNWILWSCQKFWFERRRQKIPHFLEQNMVTVVRQNKQQKIPSSQIVVGDMLQIKQGDTIPADGWLIEGKNIIVEESHITGRLETRKNTFRECLLQMKSKLEGSNISGEDLISQCSPALIGGSLVQSGYGRMIVLCVGELSREGTLLQNSQLKYQTNIYMAKIENMLSSRCSLVILINIMFVIIEVVKVALSVYSDGLQAISSKDEWEQYISVLWLLVIGLPQGLQLGIMIGLWILKAKAYMKDKIWIDYCEDITKMANVNLSCFDRAFERGKIIYREWWNEQNHLFYKETAQDQKGLETEEGELELQEDVCDEFRSYFEKAAIFRECKQPHQVYLSGSQTYYSESELNNWSIYEERVTSEKVKYVCQHGKIKYVLLEFNNEGEKIHLVLGDVKDVLPNCVSMMSKTTGTVNNLNQTLSEQITFTVDSMNRRFMATSIIACFTSNTQTCMGEEVKLLTTAPLTFLCLVGASAIKEHSQYQIAHRIKEAGIKLMLVSDCELEEATLRSKYIGINSPEQETLALTGSQYFKLIGDVQCSDCKRSICVCQVKFKEPRVKNMAQLRHVEKSFRVVGQASPSNKYALMVGMKNIDKIVAFMGEGEKDWPALAHCYLPITAGTGSSEGYAVSFEKSNIKNLSRLIIWSRFSHEFIRKYVQLMMPPSIVGIVLVMLGVLINHQLIVGMLPLTWVCAVVCPLLAVALSWQTPSQNLLSECTTKYEKDCSLISGCMMKQIISQVTWQLFVLIAVMLTGHLWIPETADQMDSIIGSDWSAKYSDSQQTLIANGLFSNPLIDSLSYSTAYLQYGIHSRHLTIAFNVFALMQIFNCLNCRKTKDRLINILEGIEIQTVIILALVFLGHLMFVHFAGQTVKIYPYGLSLIQWFISIGIAVSVWLISFLVKLLPEPPNSRVTHKLWVNRSVNLGVKLVAKKSKLTEFEIEEEIQLKIQ